MKVTKTQTKVLHCLQFLGMGTMHEVAIKLFIPLHHVSGRFGELRARRLIKIVGEEKIPGRRGRSIYMLAANIEVVKE